MRKVALLMISMLAICAPLTPAQIAPLGVLTDATLKTMLVNLGYSVEDGKAEDTSTIYYINLAPMEGWKVVTMASLSGSKNYLWLTATLYTIPEGKSAPADALLGMLSENNDIGPMQFYFSKSAKKFYLGDPIPNQNVTPATMRDHIDRLNKALARTEPLWNPAKWPAR